MTQTHIIEGEAPFFGPSPRAHWKRRALVYGLPVLLLLLLLVMLWNTFFRYVPPGHMLVVIAKNGTDLPPGQVLADEGQRGIRRQVLGEGWHWVTPIVYTTEVHPNVAIPPGKVGIVTALGGVAPADGRVLAEKEDEQGIRRRVLLPGSYRLNPYGFKVEQVEATVIKPGYVGVVQRLLGKDGSGRFAARDSDEKGILREVLQPGLYYLNTKEFKVIPCEVGIDQTSYHYAENDKDKDTAITFPAKDGNTIIMDCTIEWEVKPADWPYLVAEYGNMAVVERNVIDQHARRISRDRGFNFGAQDFLEGDKRETFQTDFTQELQEVCKENKVVVRSAFIRNIVIPGAFLKQKRDRQLAMERKVTSDARKETAESTADAAEAKGKIEQATAGVEAETARLVAKVEQDTRNVTAQTDAEIEKLKAQYAAQIAEQDGKRQKLKGEAEAEAKKLKAVAKSSIFKMKREVFQNDGDAFLRYTLSQQLNEKLVLRLFHSGPGTLWTNMGNKNMNFLLPVPGAGGDPKPAPEPMPAAADKK